MSLLTRLGFFDVPDLTGRVALITGGNSGIGFETVKTLVQHNCEVYIATRSLEKGQDAVSRIKKEVPKARVHARHCDLEKLASVKAFAQSMLDTDKPIHLLINNAGRFVDAPYAVTEDGFEQVCASNFWGHAYLTLLLLDRIMHSEPARIVSVISFGELFGRIKWSDLRGVDLHTSGLPAYGVSKLQKWMFMQELQQRLKRSGRQVDVFGVQPGLVRTGLLRKADFRYPTALASWVSAELIGLPPSQGARSTIYAATNPGLQGRGGKYIGLPYALFFLPWFLHTWEAPAWNPNAHSQEECLRLFDESVRILEEATGAPVPTVKSVVVKFHASGKAVHNGADGTYIGAAPKKDD